MDDKQNRSGGSGGRRLSGTVTVGRYRGRAVLLAVDRDPPGARAPDEFAANCFVPDADGANHDVVRVDTAHAGCHVDRLYLPTGHPERRRDYSVTLYSPEDVLEWLLEGERWREFVERYDAVHGLPTRATAEFDEE